MSAVRYTRRMAGRRKRRLLWAALPAAVVLAASVKLLSLAPLGAAAEDAFGDGNAPALAAAADWLGILNLVEPYKADFARGDAYALRGDFEAARTSFERALRGAPESDGCRIRVNLALSIEKLGDARRNTDGVAAKAFYLDALAVIKAAPPGCFAAGGRGNADGEGKRLSEAGERLRSKTVEHGSKGNDDGDEQGGDPAAREQLERLEESERQAQEERRQSRERSEYLQDTGTGGEVERPW